MSTDISLSDYLEIRNIAFEWAESYDSKDWDRLKNILAPKSRLDLRSLMGELHEDITPDEYAAILLGPRLLGPKRLKSQHLFGGAKWEQQRDGPITVTHQIHVLYQLYTDESLSEVANKGHAHGTVQHGYRKIDGAWKLDIVVPKLNWFEHDLFGTLSPTGDEKKSG